MRPILTLLVALAPFAPLPSTAQPYLVKDINPTFENVGSSPGQFVAFSQRALFTATTLAQGNELWMSDGTEAGTSPLADLCQGTCGSGPFILATTPRGVFFTTTESGHPRSLWITQGSAATTLELTEAAGSAQSPVWLEGPGLLFFRTEDAQGLGLWRSDGTPAGTFRLTNIADIGSNFGGTVTRLVPFKGRLYYLAGDGASGIALWTSDGTAAGTRIVKVTSSGGVHSNGPVARLVAADNLLYFQAPGPSGWELWRSDGTPDRTRMIADLAPGPASPYIYEAKTAGSRLYMEAEVDFRGRELWVSDGTKAGTRRLTDFTHIVPFAPSPIGPHESGIANAAAIGSKLFFVANEVALGRQLWTSDGTAKGTHAVTSFCPAACVGVINLWPAQGNRVYFVGSDGTRGLELWTSDGTNTHIVRDICRRGCSSSPSNPIPFGSQLVFAADDGVTGRQVWRTNSTAAGTVRISDLPQGKVPSELSMAATGDRLFFAADDGVHGPEPWTSDGTLAGTHLLDDLEGADHGGSAPTSFMTAGGTLYFFADDGVHGEELWKSDGSATGTKLVHEFSPGPQAQARFSTYTPSVELNGKLFFLVELGLSPRALWTTDGTDAGTVRLTAEEVEVGQGGAFGGGPVVVGGKIFFSCGHNGIDRELCVSDGTPAGTRRLGDLAPGNIGAEPRDLVPFLGKLYFLARSPTLTDRVLWSSDGTEAGTAPVTASGLDARALTLHQGRLYFFAEDGHGRLVLWRSDGTLAGTGIAADLFDNQIDPGSVQSMVSFGSRLLLWVGSGTSRPGIWQSDGTYAGTKRLGPAWRNFSLSDVQVLGGTLFYSGYDGLPGSKETLWQTDGTEAGTHAVRDPNGEVIPEPVAMAVFDGRLYFTTRVTGFNATTTTLWRSDGTTGRTQPFRVTDFPRDAAPSLAVSGPRLFFSAYDPATGLELWALQQQ